MYFPIIQLSTTSVTEDDYIQQDWLFDDDTVNDNSDYLSDAYSPEERKEFIKKELPKIFKGIAKVNAKKETLTFLSAKTIAKTVKKDLNNKMAELKQKQADGLLTSYDFRRAGKWFRDDEVIVNYNCASYLSAMFMENSVSCAGQTVYIGGIVKAHS